MKKLATLIVIIGGLVVSGCGLRGDLERPPPAWGNPQQSDSAE
ncbi:lipoprotein [Hyphobacterium sp.]|jgi:predicted small lipoprotein YifL